MNALNRDLKKLTTWLEELKGQCVKEDPYCLTFHLMPKVGWLNDPNGLCHYNGEYHVFFQYAPFDAKGGAKFWGHYTSIDMINWQDEGTALYADQPFDCHGVYSGSALIEDGKMYLYYTGNVKEMGDYDYIIKGRQHNTVLAVSEDGRTFKHKQLLMTNADYPENMTAHIRDPKVWKENDTYYMVQGARDKEDVGQILVFASSDKVNWKVINTLRSSEKFGYMWECPDLFELDGDTVLMLSPQGIEAEGIKYQNIYQSGYYFLKGDFKTSNYTLGQFEELDRGFDFYAPQTFIDEKGRRILIGWMGLPDIDDLYSNPTVAYGWQHALTLPRELQIKDGKLIQKPVIEIEALRQNEQEWAVKDTLKVEAPKTFEIDLKVDLLKDDFELIIKKGMYLTYKKAEGLFTLAFDGCGYGRDKRSVKIDVLRNLRLFVDTSSVEVFLNDGEEVFSSRFYPEADERSIELRGHSLEGKLTLWEMKAMNIENKGDK